jgi:S1-C subfamily serine protease
VHIGPTALLGVDVATGTGAGATIAGVVSGGPADKAGLAVGDVITSLGGQSITSADALTKAMTSQSPGATVKVGYTNATGTTHSADVHLASGPPQ